MNRHRTVTLGEVVDPVRTWNPQRADSGTFDYIDLSAVDQDSKSIAESTEIEVSNAPSRARQILQTDDILVSTVRPNLNAVARVPRRFDGATASTGFCVLRPSRAKADPGYLFHWVRSAEFVADMVRNATGASYPAVSDRIIKNSVLKFPPLDEQRRIAAILDKADALRQKRKRAIALLDSLTQAVFVDMFGDPISNPRGWERVSLGETGVLDRGVSRHRPRNDPRLLGGKHPLIQTGDVARSGGYITTFSSTYSDFGLAQSRKWPTGTLCITIAANIASTGILTFDACFPDSVVGFTSNTPGMTQYVRVWMSFLKEMLERTAPTVAQKNINLEILRTLPVPMPPSVLVAQFDNRVRGINLQLNHLRNQLLSLSHLFSSLQHRAFSGHL